jgi:hypothetical protein
MTFSRRRVHSSSGARLCTRVESRRPSHRHHPALRHNCSMLMGVGPAERAGEGTSHRISASRSGVLEQQQWLLRRERGGRG